MERSGSFLFFRKAIKVRKPNCLEKKKPLQKQGFYRNWLRG
jgi:hypothetical protein